jgi:hypothetical protein
VAIARIVVTEYRRGRRHEAARHDRGRNRRPHGAIVAASEYPVRMAETLQPEQVPARLAEIREQLKLLSDYL